MGRMGMLPNMNELYQEKEDCVYGMDRREIDMEKAYAMVIGAPDITMVWVSKKIMYQQ